MNADKSTEDMVANEADGELYPEIVALFLFGHTERKIAEIVRCIRTAGKTKVTVHGSQDCQPLIRANQRKCREQKSDPFLISMQTEPVLQLNAFPGLTRRDGEFVEAANTGRAVPPNYTRCKQTRLASTSRCFPLTTLPFG